MSVTGCLFKFVLIYLIVQLSFYCINCTLLDNVNNAIVENIREELSNRTAGEDKIDVFLKLFTEQDLGTIAKQGVSVTEACDGAENITTCRQYLQFNCINVEELLQSSDYGDRELTDWFPPIVHNIYSEGCADTKQDSDSHSRKKTPSAQAWGYGLGFVTLICISANIGGLMAPCMKKNFFQRILMFCVALAVGTLAATGLLVLIPESLNLSEPHPGSDMPDYRYKMATVMAGIYFFYVSERLLKIWLSKPKGGKKGLHSGDLNDISDPISPSDHDEEEKLPVVNHDVTVDFEGLDPALMSNSTHEMTEAPKENKHKLTTIGLMILVGDALHNFVDGIAIGAAFTENTYLGISVSLSVICEELPHELGDIAILLHTGLNMRRSLCYNFLAALTCYAGLAIGILLGENTDANMWIFAVAGGMFVYLSLVDMVPEMNNQVQFVEESGIENKWTILFIQNLGLVTGFVIIMMLVMFGGNIEV